MTEIIQGEAMPVESYKQDGRPAQQWYWDDWFAAFDVRACSLAARGLWIDMLGIMFKAEIRGTLTINGNQVDIRTLAKLVNESEENVEKYLAELERYNVFSRLDDGTIICRRMYRESKKQEEIKQKKSVAGKIGMAKRYHNSNRNINTNLTENMGNNYQNDNKDLTEGYNRNLTKLTASTSISTSTSSSINKEINKVRNQIDDFGLLFEELWKQWPAEGRFKKKYCRMKFLTLCKQGKLEEFKKTAQGYSEYLKHKRINENFNQRPMHLATFLNNWEEEKEQFMGFEYRPKF
jgi:hypothetical protein